MINLYNTASRKIEEFKPINDDKVTIYTCGPTVYDYQHIGNYTGYIYWDVLVRLLKQHNFKTNRVMNITDVGHLVSDADEGEDKLEKGARREGKTAWEVADFYSEDFFQSIAKLNLTPADVYAKATEHIEQQVNLVKVLEAKGYTYKTDDGLYFDTSKFSDYAKFAKLDLSEQALGHRVAVNPQKRHAQDFALWKFSPKGQKRDMQWPSPWGEGFPGWHIECSAMALHYLGDTVDIHTGGIDHIPVHHTNEIAQSQAATGQNFVNFWLHNNFMKINGKKISKSLNNGLTLADLKEKGYSALDFKLLVLQSHYRSESNFTWESLHASSVRHKSYQAFADKRWQASTSSNKLGSEFFANASKKLLDELSSDLASPQALSHIDKVINEVDGSTQAIHQSDLEWHIAFVKLIDDLLGLRLSQSEDISDTQKELIHKRLRARHANDWQAADAIRDELLSDNIILNDTDLGVIWYRK